MAGKIKAKANLIKNSSQYNSFAKKNGLWAKKRPQQQNKAKSCKKQKWLHKNTQTHFRYVLDILQLFQLNK